MKGALEKYDNFGEALASGDFDADGYANLAIGVPHENVGRIGDAGIVQVLYGSARGLTARDQIWHQGKPGVPGSNERSDRFGATLAAGDFDSDGYADLVIGSPSEDVGSLTWAGRAVVLRGGPGGLTAAGALSLRQGSGGIPSQPESGEQFGRELAVGDVNGDGRDDLAIGVVCEKNTPGPGWEAPTCENWGPAVHLLLGSPSGLTSGGNQLILADELFASRVWRLGLTFGDVNRDGRADLVMASQDGAVGVLHGHPDGVHPAPLPVAAQPGQDGKWSAGFGDAFDVAAGDITGDGNPDVVVVGGDVILGTPAGLSPTTTRWGIGNPEADFPDVAILVLSGGSHAWLATSEPEASDPGAVTVVRGTAAGTAGPVTVWSQDSPGIKNRAERGDGFGAVIGG